MLFLILLTFSLFGEQTDFLFHLHDAGETYALLPVIRELDDEYLVMATGTSSHLIAELPQDRVRPFESYPQIEPKAVVTGVASELQGDVLDFFRGKAMTFAFWDNFNANGESPYFQRAHAIEPKADILLLPCQTLVLAFPDRRSVVVGHPTLDPKPAKKVVLWIGGYGKEYEEAFQLFQEGMKGVEGVAVLTLHHPKTGLKSDLKFVDALPLADLVICHQSTAAFQALAANKPVLHVIPPNQTFDSLPLQKGLAKRVGRSEDFPQAVKEAFEADVSGFFELMGIPEKNTLKKTLSELVR